MNPPNGADPLPVYVTHEGTIRVAGDTSPTKAGMCAFHFVQRGFKRVEFSVIGGNAQQQAAKAMGVCRQRLEESSAGVHVSFRPMRYSVFMDGRFKDCIVWELVISRTE